MNSLKIIIYNRLLYNQANFHSTKMTSIQIETIPLKEIKSIEFSIMGPEEIIRSSHVQVTSDKSMNLGEPEQGGLYDKRMGVLDYDMICDTCFLRGQKCPGHFGHFILPDRIFNPLFINDIVKLLKVICNNDECNRVILTDIQMEALLLHERKDRLTRAVNETKKVFVCPHCDHSLRDYKIHEKADFLISHFDKKKGKSKRSAFIYPEEVEKILAGVISEDYEPLGFNPNAMRLNYLVMSVLPVPPVTVRPFAKSTDKNRHEDDIFTIWKNIIRTSASLSDAMKNKHSQAEKDQNLYWGMIEGVTLWFDLLCTADPKNTSRKINFFPDSRKSKRAKAYKSIHKRLNGKKGLFRENLLGKRVDQCIRGVINNAVTDSIETLNIPKKLAMNTNTIEVVNEFNIDRCRTYVRNGNNVFPGASSVRKKNGRTILLLDNKPQHQTFRNTIANQLEYGDIVNRHLITGDPVNFSREPILHKDSISGFKANVVNNDDTFAVTFLVVVAKPFNADYDGDEMNVNVNQSITTKIENELIMNIRHKLINTAKSELQIFPVLDPIYGIYTLANYDKPLSKRSFMTIVADMPEIDFDKIENKDEYTGIDVINFIIPDEVNIAGKIVNGIINDGVSVDGGLLKEIISFICLNVSFKLATKFIIDVEKVANKWISLYGFTISMRDIDVDEEVNDRIEEEVKKTLLEVDEILEQIDDGRKTKIIGINRKDFYEREVIAKFNNLKSIITEEITIPNMLEREKRYGYRNMALTLIDSKSGKRDLKEYIIFMNSIIGQQSIQGNRLPPGYGERPLPHFQKYSMDPIGYGFIASNYAKGLTPTEYWSDNVPGRDGLANKVLAVADVGYHIQMKLIKALDSNSVCSDNTVRQDCDKVMETMYGVDGIDPIYIERVKMNDYHLSDNEFRKKYNSL